MSAIVLSIWTHKQSCLIKSLPVHGSEMASPAMRALEMLTFFNYRPLHQLNPHYNTFNTKTEVWCHISVICLKYCCDL